MLSIEEQIQRIPPAAFSSHTARDARQPQQGDNYPVGIGPMGLGMYAGDVIWTTFRCGSTIVNGQVYLGKWPDFCGGHIVHSPCVNTHDASWGAATAANDCEDVHYALADHMYDMRPILGEVSTAALSQVGFHALAAAVIGRTLALGRPCVAWAGKDDRSSPMARLRTAMDETTVAAAPCPTVGGRALPGRMWWTVQTEQNSTSYTNPNSGHDVCVGSHLITRPSDVARNPIEWSYNRAWAVHHEYFCHWSPRRGWRNG